MGPANAIGAHHLARVGNVLATDPCGGGGRGGGGRGSGLWVFAVVSRPPLGTLAAIVFTVAHVMTFAITSRAVKGAGR